MGIVKNSCKSEMPLFLWIEDFVYFAYRPLSPPFCLLCWVFSFDKYLCQYIQWYCTHYCFTWVFPLTTVNWVCRCEFPPFHTLFRKLASIFKSGWWHLRLVHTNLSNVLYYLIPIEVLVGSLMSWTWTFHVADNFSCNQGHLNVQLTFYQSKVSPFATEMVMVTFSCSIVCFLWRRER